MISVVSTYTAFLRAAVHVRGADQQRRQRLTHPANSCAVSTPRQTLADNNIR